MVVEAKQKSNPNSRPSGYFLNEANISTSGITQAILYSKAMVVLVSKFSWCRHHNSSIKPTKISSLKVQQEPVKKLESNGVVMQQIWMGG